MPANVIYTDTTREVVVKQQQKVREVDKINLSMSVEDALFLLALLGGTRDFMERPYNDLVQLFGGCPDGYSKIPDPSAGHVAEIRRMASEFLDKNTFVRPVELS